MQSKPTKNATINPMDSSKILNDSGIGFLKYFIISKISEPIIIGRLIKNE